MADLLTGSRWHVALVGVEPGVLQRAVSAFLAEDAVPVERMTKNGLRGFDARGAVVSIETDPSGLVVTLADQVPLVRPDDVLTALHALTPEFDPAEIPVLTRLTQGRLDPETGDIAEP